MMRNYVVCFELLFFCGAVTFGASGHAQQISTPQHLATTAEAKNLLLASVEAMGGLTHWEGVTDATVVGSCIQTGASTGQTPSAKQFRWITAGDQFRYESDTQGQGSVMLSAHGKQKVDGTNSTRSRPLTGETTLLSQPYHLPAQVLHGLLANPDFYSRIVGDEVLDGHPATHLHTDRYIGSALIPGATQDWWFDATTKLPIKVTFFIPGQKIITYFPATLKFASWSAEAADLVVPHSLALVINQNMLSQTCSVSEFHFNSQPPSSVFDAR